MAPRRRVLLLALLLAAVLGLAPAATAATQIAPGTVRVQLKSAPTRITPAGAARVVMWTKCSPDLYLFEIAVSVVQDGRANQRTLQRGVDVLPVCDGTRHRFVVTVPAAQGNTLHAGPAGVGVFVGAYSDATNDLESTDDTTVRLYEPAARR